MTSGSRCRSRTCAPASAGRRRSTTYYGSAWSADASTLFYVTVDDAWRPYRVWRHVIGTPAGDDVIVYEEPDERFWVGVELTRSERFILIDVGSKVTSEVRYLPADRPSDEPAVIAPRRQGVEYSVEHHGHRFLILHNDGAEDFALARHTSPGQSRGRSSDRAPPGTPAARGVDAFTGTSWCRCAATASPACGVAQRRRRPSTMEFPEPLYSVGLAGNPEYDTTTVRISYTSMVTPESIFDVDLDQRTSAQAPAGARRVRPRRLRAASRVGAGRRRHPGADLVVPRAT